MKTKSGRLKIMDLSSCWSKNKTTKNLPGEKWKPVPGLEDTHEVSNYGRFRCLDKMIYPRNGKNPYLRKGHLMSPAVGLSPNFHAKDFTYHPALNVETREGTISFSIRRLVYHCFVEPIKLHAGASPKYLIIPKDGNGLNTHYRNLAKATKSEIELAIYRNNRIPNTLKSLTRKERIRMAQKGVHKRYKAVSQYDKNGYKIAYYPSLKDAAMQSKILLSTIGNAAKGRLLTAGGFIWRQGNGPDKIAIDHLTKKMDNFLSRVSQQITQYDLKGTRVCIYPSIREASRTTGFNKSTLSACLNGRLKTANGFFWQRGAGPKKKTIKVRYFKIGVIKCSVKGKELESFPSVFTASQKTGIPYHQIRASIDSKNILNGYLWCRRPLTS